MPVPGRLGIRLSRTGLRTAEIGVIGESDRAGAKLRPVLELELRLFVPGENIVEYYTEKWKKKKKKKNWISGFRV